MSGGRRRAPRLASMRREELAGLLFMASMLALLASVVAQSTPLCLAGVALYAAAALMDGWRR